MTQTMRPTVVPVDKARVRIDVAIGNRQTELQTARATVLRLESEIAGLREAQHQLDKLTEIESVYSDREGNLRRVGDGGIDDPNRA